MIKNVAARVPVRILASTGAPVVGVSVEMIDGGVATVVNADGTTLDIALVASGTGQNFFEVDPVKAPGLYHLLLPGSALNVVGFVQWSVQPASPDAFQPGGAVGNAEVEDTDLAPIEQLLTAIQSRLVAVEERLNGIPGKVWDEKRAGHTTAGTFGELMRLIRQVFAGRVLLNEGAGTLTIYAEDGVTALQIQALKDGLGRPAGLQAIERLAAQ
jgi:hypothetical protein